MELKLSTPELVKHSASILLSGRPVKKCGIEGESGDWASSSEMNIMDLLTIKYEAFNDSVEYVQ